MARRSQAEIELVAVNEALSEKLAQVIADHSAAEESFTEMLLERDAKIVELKEEIEQWKRLRRESSDVAQDYIGRLKRCEEERDGARDDLMRRNISIRGLEVERDEARVHARLMRSQAYPEAPSFPWEAGR